MTPLCFLSLLLAFATGAYATCNTLCFESNTYTVDVPENATVGSSLLTVMVTNTSGSAPEYKLLHFDTIFSINSSGVITLLQPLDFEDTRSYHMSVQASVNMYVTTASVDLTVLDVNDNRPYCSPDLLYVAVSEETDMVDPVLQFPCHDADDEANGVFPNYEVESLALLDVSVSVTDGKLYLGSRLDCEASDRHNFSITVTDNGTPQMSTSVSVVLLVEPVNEFGPVFVEDVFEFSVNELTELGTPVGNVTATDKDCEYYITYSIPFNDHFCIDSLSGVLYLTKSLDYEMVSSYEVEVTAFDHLNDTNTPLSSNATIRISVLDSNDNPPVFTKPLYTMQVAENIAIDEHIIDVECTDADTNASIVYSESYDFFDVDEDTGSISLSMELNYEEVQLHRFTVTCSDAGSPGFSSVAVVLVQVQDVNEYHPSLYNTEFEAQVPEDVGIGSNLTKIIAHDQDLDGVLRYQFVLESECPIDTLDIDSLTGDIYLINNLDYEKDQNLHCEVNVTDGERSRMTDLIIHVLDINDVPPTCANSVLTRSLSEDAPVNTQVTNFSCIDGDSEDLEYSLSSDTFYVDSCGDLFCMFLGSALDYETRDAYALRIEVTDGRYNTSVTVHVLVSPVNEFPPVFMASSYECNVSEAAALGIEVCQILASDQDEGEDGKFQYRIVDDDEENIPFSIDTSSGDIIVTGRLDYEAHTHYNFSVSSCDFGVNLTSLCSNATIYVWVINENDNHPTCASNIFAQVKENSSYGKVITTLECVDDDLGMYGQTGHEILNVTGFSEGGNSISMLPKSFFLLNTSYGVVAVNEDIDYETYQLFEVYTKCKDGGIPSLSCVSKITLEVVPENEYQPTFSKEAYSVTVPESLALGSTLSSDLVAFDEDEGSDGRIEYSLVGSADYAVSISSSSGQVTLTRQLNCSEETQYSYTVLAQDGGNPSRSSMVSLGINITDCSLGRLVAERETYFANVTEESITESPIITLSCLSERYPETNLSQKVRYSLANSSTTAAENSLFSVGPDSGDVAIVEQLDYEVATFHSQPFHCFYTDAPEMLEMITLYVSVLPLNEYTPTFDDDEDEHSISISEMAPVGSSVTRIHAQDLDSGKDGEIHYTIETTSTESDGLPFAIDLDSGKLYVIDHLDREEKSSFSFNVIAQDCSEHGGSSDVKSATLPVLVNILDSNDNPPRCTKRFDYVTITLSQASPGDVLLALNCSDLDEGANSQLNYAITNNATKFGVNATSGVVTLKESLAAEDAGMFYSITVEVSDGGTPSPLSSSVYVIVNVESSPSSVNDGAVTSPPSNTSAVENEGIRNSVSMTVKDISIELWIEGAEDNCLNAIARSVTQHCALMPEACSLKTGCSEFYSTSNSRKRSDFYQEFMAGDVVLNPGYPKETVIEGLTSLELKFFVALPQGVQKAQERVTDYVIPEEALRSFVAQDSTVIEAVTRDSVAPPITQSVCGNWKNAAVAAFVVMATILLALAVVAVMALVCRNKGRGRSRKVVPISQAGGPAVNMDSRRSCEVPYITPHPAQHLGSERSPSDGCSDILTTDNEFASMENNGRESMSNKDILRDLESIRSQGEGSCLRDYDSDSGDYIQNWPFAPPNSFGPYVRPGNVKVNTWTTRFLS